MRATVIASAITTAVVALLAACVLWVAGFALVEGGMCPAGSQERSLTGLDTPRSAWPPGVACTDRATSGGQSTEVVQIFDGLTAVIVGLVVAAGAILLLAGVATFTRAGVEVRRAGKRERQLTEADGPL
jgi:hypothetical protein